MSEALAIKNHHKGGKIHLNLTVIIFSVVGLILVLMAVLAPWIAPHNPNVGKLDDRLLPPFWQRGGTTDFLLGTDTLGRDILSRIIYGARTTLSVCALVVIIAGSLGTFLGIIAGYLGGWFDIIIMRAVDLVYSLPAILLALLLGAIFRAKFSNIGSNYQLHALGWLCQDGQGRDIKGKRFRLCCPGQDCWLLPGEHYDATYFPECCQPDYYSGDSPGGHDCYRRGFTELSRRRYSATHRRLGLDGV